MKNDIYNLTCLDIDSSPINAIELKDNNLINYNTKLQSVKIMPLLSWDIYIQHYYNLQKDLIKEQEISKLKLLAKKLNWKNNIDIICKKQNFEAIVVTDINHSILWVNDGFTKMTGYTKKYALNKKPKFLQGAKTSSKSKKRIRIQLNKNKPFTAIITNYKKDNTSYKCKVKIFPLYDYNREITHFLALERQVV